MPIVPANDSLALYRPPSRRRFQSGAAVGGCCTRYVSGPRPHARHARRFCPIDADDVVRRAAGVISVPLTGAGDGWGVCPSDDSAWSVSIACSSSQATAFARSSALLPRLALAARQVRRG
jgi:hypothetical protein